MTDSEAIYLIQAGYTPRYVEQMQAHAKGRKSSLATVTGSEETGKTVDMLARRWGITQPGALRAVREAA